MRYGRRNRYPGNGPFSDLPPYQRPGYLYGGRGQGYMGTDPTKCARFPWLQRWWWANPSSENLSAGTAPPTAPLSEKEFLENPARISESRNSSRLGIAWMRSEKQKPNKLSLNFFGDVI